MRTAVLGGTGKFGVALARRLLEAGAEVVIGSRDAERAGAVAVELACEGMTNAAACVDADLVFLAVRADAALETAREHADAIGSTPLFSVAAELNFSKDGVRPTSDARSLAERIQDVVQGPVVAGLHSLAATNLGAVEPPEEDALVCGDDRAAKELALELAGRLVRGRAIDAGPLASARTLEGMTAVIVNVNRRYKAHVGLRLNGLK